MRRRMSHTVRYVKLAIQFLPDFGELNIRRSQDTPAESVYAAHGLQTLQSMLLFDSYHLAKLLNYRAQRDTWTLECRLTQPAIMYVCVKTHQHIRCI